MTFDADVTLDAVGSLENAALLLSRIYRGEKRLVFCDSRARVESLSALLRKLGQRTFVCHSSLGSMERRQAEEAFAEASDGIIVATSAMELGIDIGDLDQVIQIDAPSSVASFLQRMGRTGRRTGSSRNCLFLATSDEALLIAAGLVRLWHEGIIESVVPPLRPLHILAQQILALILQRHGLPENGWRGWIGKTFAGIEASDAASVIGAMKAMGILVDDQGILGMGPIAEATLGRRNFLELLSAFTTPLLMSVRHGNADLGEVAPTTLTAIRDAPAILLLGGRSWRVTNVDWKKRVAWVEPCAEDGRSIWPGSSRRIPHSLCRAIEGALIAHELPVKLSKRAKAAFAVLCEEYAFCDGHSLPLVVSGDGQSRLWTFAGSSANGPIANTVAENGFPSTRFDNFSVSVKNGRPADVARLVNRLEPADCTPSIPAGLDRALKFATCLPAQMSSAILTERLRDEEGLKATLARPVRIVEDRRSLA